MFQAPVSEPITGYFKLPTLSEAPSQVRPESTRTVQDVLAHAHRKDVGDTSGFNASTGGGNHIAGIG